MSAELIEIEGVTVCIPHGWRRIDFGSVRETDRAFQPSSGRFVDMHPWGVGHPAADFYCVIREIAK